MRTAIICGGPGAEHDVSILTGLQAQRALVESGATAGLLYWDKLGRWHWIDTLLEAKSFLDGVSSASQHVELSFADGDANFVVPRRLGRATPIEVDGFVVCCHGSPGECGRLQSVLDLMGVAYTGPSMPGAALGMDKLAFASLAESVGVRCIPRADLANPGDLANGGPLVVKPRFGGSSIGVEVVESLETARAVTASRAHYSGGAIVEPFLEGWYDVNISVRRSPQYQTTRIERPIRGDSAILSYEAKYVPGVGMSGAARELPAQLPADLESEVLRSTQLLADASMVRGVARLDFMTNGTEILVNEINTIPGSLARYLWDDVGIDFPTLLIDMLDEAISHHAYVPSLAGADGSILRSAGSIAAKLM
jgi:D-alanine-D-alanine ligase